MRGLQFDWRRDGDGECIDYPGGPPLPSMRMGSHRSRRVRLGSVVRSEIILLGLLQMTSLLLAAPIRAETPLLTGGWITRGPVRDYIGSVALAPTQPSILYASGGNSDMYKSVDGGRTWAQVGSIDCCFGSADITVDPSSPDVAFAAADYLGLYKTNDGGASWPEIDDSDVDAVAINPAQSNVVLESAGDDYDPDFGLNRSLDGGLTWSPTGFVAWVTTLAIDPSDSSIVYAGLFDGRVFRRRANGAWISISSGLPGDPILAMAIDPIMPNIVYVGTALGVYRRTSRAHRWIYVSSGFGDSWTDALAIDPAHEGWLYAGTNGDGVYRSTDGGRTWAPFNQGLFDLAVTSLAITPSGSILYAGTENSGVFQTRTGVS